MVIGVGEGRRQLLDKLVPGGGVVVKDPSSVNVGLLMLIAGTAKLLESALDNLNDAVGLISRGKENEQTKSL